jgi:hypothetical protein
MPGKANTFGLFSEEVVTEEKAVMVGVGAMVGSGVDLEDLVGDLEEDLGVRVSGVDSVEKVSVMAMDTATTTTITIMDITTVDTDSKDKLFIDKSVIHMYIFLSWYQLINKYLFI